MILNKQFLLLIDSELNRAILYEILKECIFIYLEATNGQRNVLNYIKQYGSGISLILLEYYYA